MIYGQILSLGEIIIIIHEKAFAGLSVMTVAGFNHLQPQENVYFLNFWIRIV